MTPAAVVNALLDAQLVNEHTLGNLKALEEQRVFFANFEELRAALQPMQQDKQEAEW